MKNFMGDTDEVAPFTVQAMMQGHDAAELDAKLAIINSLADQCGARRDSMLDAMAEAMGTPTGEESEMDWMAIFNSFGIAAWLPFTLPRQGFADVYKKLISLAQRDGLKRQKSSAFACAQPGSSSPQLTPAP